jgi:hypothetical protein
MQLLVTAGKQSCALYAVNLLQVLHSIWAATVTLTEHMHRLCQLVFSKLLLISCVETIDSYSRQESGLLYVYANVLHSVLPSNPIDSHV